MANTKDIKGKKVIKAALFGGLVGGVTGLLLAPKSGQELRQDLALQVHELGDKAAVIKDKAHNAWQNVEDKTQITVEAGKSFLEKGRRMGVNLKTLIHEIQNGALTKTNTVYIAEEKLNDVPKEEIVLVDNPINPINPIEELKINHDSIEEIMIIENEHEY